MTHINTWHENQQRTEKKTFAPKWTNETLLWIIEQVKHMNDFIDIQVALVKKYKISLASAELWIEMSRRIMKDMNNGLSLEDALERDKERRNISRRVKRDQVA